MNKIVTKLINYRRRPLSISKYLHESNEIEWYLREEPNGFHLEEPNECENVKYSPVKGGFVGVGNAKSFCISIWITEVMVGRRDGDSWVHNRPIWTALNTSSSTSSLSRLVSMISDTVFAWKCLHVCENNVNERFESHFNRKQRFNMLRFAIHPTS